MAKINARNKGHAYERKIRKDFIDLGWYRCQTSRYASRELDDAKVDLCNTEPYNVQIKAVESGVNYHKMIFKEMPQDDNINVVIHKRNRKQIVAMPLEAFYKLAEQRKTLDTKQNNI